jgi:hypothetical protein
MTGKKSEKLTEKEKEQQRLVIPFEKTKQFITNLNAILESSDLFKEWEIKLNSLVLKSTSLSMKFLLKGSAIEKEIDALDKSQKRMAEFLDPDQVPEAELVEIGPE